MAFLQEYTMLDELGRGGFATVYKVRHNELGYIRAVRVLNETIVDSNSPTWQKFLRECKVLLRLGNGNHPNIVHIYQPRLLDSRALVEMDYVDGQDVLHYLKQNLNFVPVEDVVRMAAQMSSALAYCHEDIYRFCMDRSADNLQDDPDDGSKVLIDEQTRKRLIEKYKVIHNDIHSGNIMRREDGNYVLLDFGLAIEGDEVVRSSRRKNGAPEFKSPEKWDDESILSEQSDIYSFGVVMYEMLAGRVPFPFDKKNSNKTEAEYLLSKAHQQSPPPSIEDIRKAFFESKFAGQEYQKDYPQWLEDVILKCLRKNPAERFRNGKELYDHINEFKNKATHFSSEEGGRLELLNVKNDELVLEIGRLREINMSLNIVLNEKLNNLLQKEKSLQEAKEELETLHKENEFLGQRVEQLLQKINDIEGDTVESKENNNSETERLSNLYLTVNNVTFTMVYVYGGTFTMGGTSEQGDDCDSNELPIHQVTLNGFYVGKTEVTRALWKAVLGNNQVYNENDTKPVDFVSWNDCLLFIEKLNQLTGKSFRLPTEAEWEYAARGGNRKSDCKFSGSNYLDEVAWYASNSDGKTHPVNEKRSNEIGLYDMSGNLCEWCADWYGCYSASPQTNPLGPSVGMYKILRGGSWVNGPNYCRVSKRDHALPDFSSGNVGFRLALIPDGSFA